MTNDSTHIRDDSVGFIPPAPTHCLIKVCQTLWPLYAKLSPFKLNVHFDSSVLRTLERLKTDKVIICPNHSAHDDPLVAFAISAQTHQQFYYLTAREIFMYHPSLRSLWLQHLGCYSVLRASPDIEAYKQTCSLLLAGANKIVLFPEGEVSHQNRRVMPLENGAERMALATAQALASVSSNEPVYILPVGITYRYNTDITGMLLAAIAEQERKLSLPPASAVDIASRLRRAFEKMIDCLEKEHMCNLPGASIGARICNFIEKTMRELSAACGVDVPGGETQLERLHAIKKVFINRRFGDRRTVVTDNARLLYKQLKRAVNLIDVSDHSFANVSSQEALAELVCILEYEISGKVTLQAERHAYVASAVPINAQFFVAEYEKDKQHAVKALGCAVQSGMNDALMYLQAAVPEHLLQLPDATVRP